MSNPVQLLNRGVPVPLMVLFSARGFQRAAVVLGEQAEGDLMMWPTITCEALSLELHIKALLEERGNQQFGHNAEALYKQLPQADRTRIEEHFNRIAPQHQQYKMAVAAGVAMDVPAVLARAQDMFIRGRYWHEGILPKSDSNGHVGNFGIGSLSDAVMERLFDLHPEWKTQLELIQFTFPTGTPFTT